MYLPNLSFYWKECDDNKCFTTGVAYSVCKGRHSWSWVRSLLHVCPILREIFLLVKKICNFHCIIEHILYETIVSKYKTFVSQKIIYILYYIFNYIFKILLYIYQNAKPKSTLINNKIQLTWIKNNNLNKMLIKRPTKLTQEAVYH